MRIELSQDNSGLRAVFEAIPDLLIRFDREGNVLETKVGATSDLRLQAAQLFGRSIQDIAVPAIRERFALGIAGAVETREVVSIEYSTLVDGQECFYEARLAPVLETEVIAIIRNITERKAAEAELFLSQHMLRTIIDTIPQRVFWKDRNSVYVGGNKAVARDCGYDDPADLVGHTDFKTSSAEVAEEFRRDDHEVMESNQPRLNYEQPQITAKGERRWLLKSKVPLHDREGKVIGVLGTYDDVTERKRLEEQFRQSQKMEAFGQLAGGVAHDFNNLLMVIIGCMSMVQSGRLSAEEQAAAIKETMLAGDRAAKLTRQLLTFSRREPLQRADLDLNEVVANTTKMLQRLIGEHITLQAHYAPGGAPIHADPGMMEQVLLNLAVNSRDAMPKGGRIIIQTATVHFRITDPKRPKARPGHYVRLSAVDDGVGIAAKHLPSIFEPFFTTKEVGKGTGLGLATVFGIVEQHQGWIEVESEVGFGTAFHVFLPRLMKEITRANGVVAGPKIRNGTETVLVVEDEAAVREFMRIALEHHGYRVHVAVSGVAAMRLWPTVRDDVALVISDMVMPEGMTGGELSEKLRADKADLKVILCSGYSREMMGDSITAEDEVAILKKPFDLPVFLHRVRDSLDAR